MASRPVCFRPLPIIQFLCLVWSFQWQESHTEVLSGHAASFSQDHWNVDAEATAEHYRRLRRALDVDSKCVIKDVNDKLQKHSHYHHFDDSNFSLMLLWTGHDGKELMALSTLEFAFFAAQSKLWISQDFGKNFKSINHKIDGAIIKKDRGLFKSLLDPRKIILISYQENRDRAKTTMYVTKDAGENFQRVDAPFFIEGSLVFHPSKSDWILAHAPMQDFQLFLSKDFGIRWETVKSNVVDFSWGTLSMPEMMIFMAVDETDPASAHGDHQEGEYKLLRSKDLGRSFETLIEKMFNYGLQGKFLYAAVADKSRDLDNSIRIDAYASRDRFKNVGNSDKRVLEVSVDHGKTWNPTHLPTITKDRFFSILDMNEGMIFIHVDDPGNTGYGTIYTSDADGIIYSKSLENHLFPNGDSVTDFYRIESIRGVYFASQVGDDGSIHTMVTFDRGGIWSSVKAPAGMKCKNPDVQCNLQIHNQYSRTKGVNLPMGPLSTKNATGLIIVHAHVSDALEVSPPDVYVSSDGGYNWSLALKGPHYYAITNHGALLLAVPAAGTGTTTVLFSYDEGHCWNNYEFSTEGPIIVTGILPEPSAQSLNISIWGFQGDDHEWRVYTIDFSAVIENKCASSDYVNWTPHLDNSHEGCLLGKKETFKKVKQDSLCQIDFNFEHSPTGISTCSCTKADYECDFGYYREDNEEECEVSLEFANKELEICEDGKEEEIITKGYRNIPGDVCEGGFKPTRNIEVLKKKCHDGNNLASAQGHKQSKAAGVVITLIVIILVGGALFLLYRERKLPCLRKTNASYSYRALSETDELDKIIDLDTKDHTYHDSSDDDMIE